MGFLGAYLRERRKAILLFLGAVLVFAVVFALYELPLGAVGYPALLCGVLFLLCGLWDLHAAQRKHRRLEEITRLPAPLMEGFPRVRSQDDADYQDIIAALRREQNRLQTDMSLRFQNMADYYTTWVHQIKTPIAAMKLALQQEDSALSRQVSEELQRIEQYVEMVLAYLRLDADATDYVFREQELDPIVREAVKKFAGQFIRKKLRLRYEPLQGRVLTDEKWLSFVIEQVLSNAVKYTPAGGVEIFLEEPLTLCIRDTGIGIAPEDLPRVFEKSYTGYNGRSDKKASGIGLYLCKRICAGLGHEIRIQSAPGEGTVVRLHLERQAGRVE